MATPRKDPKDLLKEGRKTLYKEVYIDEVDLYIQSCEDKEYDYITFQGSKGIGKEKKTKVHLPTLEGFGEYLRNKYPGTRTTTTHIWNWEEEHPEFLEATTRIRNAQAIKLMNGTLSGDYEKSMAQLILRSQSRHYQPIDKQEHSGKDGGAIEVNNISNGQLDEIITILNQNKK
jgi:hypothetical protein